MLLEFYGIKSEEKELRKLFKTTPLHGTYWKFVVDGMKQLNINFVYLRNQSFKALEEMIKNETPLAVSIHSSVAGTEDDTNHVVVVVGIKENRVVIHDPEIGKYIEINKNDFLDAWTIRENRIGYIVRK